MKSLYIFVSLAIIFFTVPVYSGDREVIRHYSKDHELRGYTIREGNRESHFSKDWNREGYSIHREDGTRVDHFTRGWDRQGHSEIDDYEKKQNTE